MSVAVLRFQAIGDERRYCLARWVSPTDAEGVARRVGVNLVALFGVQVACLKEPRSQLKGGFVGRARILDVKVEVHLLRAPVRPLRRQVVRRQLHADMPFTRGI